MIINYFISKVVYFVKISLAILIRYYNMKLNDNTILTNLNIFVVHII